MVQMHPVACEVVPVEGRPHVLHGGTDGKQFQSPAPDQGLRTFREILVHPPLIVIVGRESRFYARLPEIIYGIRPVLMQQKPGPPRTAEQFPDLGGGRFFQHRTAQHDGIKTLRPQRQKRCGQILRPLQPEDCPFPYAQRLQMPSDLRIPTDIPGHQYTAPLRGSCHQ